MNRISCIFVFASFIAIGKVHASFQTYPSSGFYQPNNDYGGQYQGQQSNFNQEPSVQCEYYSTGLFAHPLDCSKFLKCDRGRTFIEKCGQGSVFNDVLKICDWPYNVDCGARNQKTQNIAGVANSPNFVEGTHRGEGIIEIRAEGKHDNRYQPTGHSTTVAQHESQAQLHFPDDENPQHSHRFFNPHYPLHNHHHHHHHHHHQNWPQQTTPTPQVPSFLPVLSQDLLPPIRPLDAVDEKIHDRLNSAGNSIGILHSASELPFNQQNTTPLNKSEEDSIPSSFNQDTVSSSATTRNDLQTEKSFPELNYMTSYVADEFNKYFASSKPKSIPLVPLSKDSRDSVEKIPDVIFEQNVPTTSNQLQDINLMTSRVTGEFNRYFSGLKSDSVPETTQLPVINIKDDLPLEPTADRSHLADDSISTGNIPPTGFPELNLMTSRVGNEFYKYFANSKTNLTPVESSGNEKANQRLSSIPNMSELPLENVDQRNTYSEADISIQNSFNRIASQGGDIPVEHFDDVNTLDGENVPSPSPFYGKPAFAIEQTTLQTPVIPIIPITSTEPSIPIASTSRNEEVEILDPLGKQTTLPVATANPYSPLDNYNKVYYKPHEKQSVDCQEPNEVNHIQISENLKHLLRPYMIERSKTKNVPNRSSLDHVNKTEDKSDGIQLLEHAIIHDPNQNKLSQPEDTTSAANVNSVDRNIPDTPITFIRPSIGKLSVSDSRRNQPHPPPGSRRSQKTNAQNQKFNRPIEQSYHKQTIHDPNKISFPGPQSQSHPMERRQ